MIQTANTSHDLLTEDMMKRIVPSIIGNIKGLCDQIGYDGVTFDRPASEYPEFFYTMLWIQLKPVVLKWLDRNHPEAWFKPVYMSTEEQRKMGLPV